jgi:hypothetical protein
MNFTTYSSFEFGICFDLDGPLFYLRLEGRRCARDASQRAKVTATNEGLFARSKPTSRSARCNE